MIERVHVPGPRVPFEELPHGLLIYEEEPGGEKGYEVIHPVDCPRGCYWLPGLPFKVGEGSGMIGEYPPETHHCYIQYELDGAGLDSLEASELTGGTHLDDWKKLPPGRYIIEGWYTPGGWAGSEPVEPEGGLTLLGPA